MYPPVQLSCFSLFQTLKRTVENIKDPLYRYFEREVNSGSKLLRDVIHDLEDVSLICQVDTNTLLEPPILLGTSIIS